MHPALLVTGKDLRQRLRDRSAIMIGLVVPLGLAAVFNLAFGGAAEGSFVPRYGVTSADDGPLGAAFLEVLDRLATEGTIELTTEPDADALRRAVLDDDYDAGWVVPAGFTADVFAGGPPAIEVMGGAGAALSTHVARSIAESFAATVTAGQLAAATTQSLSAEPLTIEDLAGRLATLPQPVALTQGQAADAQLDLTTYLAAGLAVFFVFFTVQFGVTSLLEERREGTLARLHAAPVPRWSVVAGKGLTSVALGVLSLTTLAVATSFLLGARWGDPLGVALLIVAAVISSTGVLALIATVARTPEQANVWQSVTAVLLGALGGVFFDVTQGSPILARLSLLTPHQWFLRGLGDVRAEGAAGALPAVGAMLTFAVVGIALATLVTRRQEAA